MPDAPLVTPIEPHPAPMPTPAAPDMAAQAAPETEPEPAPEEQEPSQKLPHDLIKRPDFMALVAGSPPAISLRLKGKENHEGLNLVKKNWPALQKAGFGLYHSLSGEFGVLFNALYIHSQDLQAADKMGKLEQIAPPADAIAHAVGKSGLTNPVLRAGAPPATFASPKSIAPPQAASGNLPQPSQSVVPSKNPPGLGKAQGARFSNLKSGGPLTGAAPGAGRLLNSILKPVV